MTDYQRHNTTLDHSTVAILKAYGGGNLSEGIRRAAELVRGTRTPRETENLGRSWSRACKGVN